MSIIVYSRENNYSKVKNLLDNGADPNIQNEYGNTALILASERGRTEIVKLLLENRADPKIQNKDGHTALILASFRRLEEIVNILLADDRTDPNIQDKQGRTALMYASMEGHTDIVKLLLEKRADLTIQNEHGLTALMYASMEGHTDIVKLLLENRADPNPNIQDKQGRTALILASGRGYIEIVKLLLEKHPNPNIQDKQGRTALIKVSERGLTEIVNILLADDRTDPNIQDNQGHTALILASIERHTNIVKLLLEKGADPNIKDEDGGTALIYASRQGHVEIVKLLLEKHPNPNIQDKQGRTALILASERGNIEIVQLLLEKHPNPNIQDKQGRTALKIAMRRGYTEIVQILRSWIAFKNVQIYRREEDGKRYVSIRLAPRKKSSKYTLKSDPVNPKLLQEEWPWQSYCREFKDVGLKEIREIAIDLGGDPESLEKLSKRELCAILTAVANRYSKEISEFWRRNKYIRHGDQSAELQNDSDTLGNSLEKLDAIYVLPSGYWFSREELGYLQDTSKNPYTNEIISDDQLQEISKSLSDTPICYKTLQRLVKQRPIGVSSSSETTAAVSFSNWLQENGKFYSDTDRIRSLAKTDVRVKFLNRLRELNTSDEFRSLLTTLSTDNLFTMLERLKRYPEYAFAISETLGNLYD